MLTVWCVGIGVWFVIQHMGRVWRTEVCAGGVWALVCGSLYNTSDVCEGLRCVWAGVCVGIGVWLVIQHKGRVWRTEVCAGGVCRRST